MFHAFSMGLKGIATTHASSIEGLIYRWTKHYKIDPNSIKLVNAIVLMERNIEASGKIIRYVKRIIEFDENSNPITIYDRIDGKLTRTISSLFDSQNIKNLIINGKKYDELRSLFFNILNKINGGKIDEKIYQ
jgi:type IV secretory pathway ATPase VirB11/archaellum biosynthesis ATPase